MNSIAIGLSLSAVQHLVSLTRKIAIGDSLSAVQHLASLTRKLRPSVASNYQVLICSQGIKGRRACRRPLMDYTFWWIAKLW